jgi:serine phosphatase RsbU (regulator of sigma subunit)
MNKLSFFWLATILLIINFSIKAQNVADSLQNLLNTSLKEEDKVLILIELAGEFTEKKPEETILRINEATSLAEKIGFQKGLGDAYNFLGTFYRRRGDYKSSLENYFKAVEIRKSLDAKSDLARTYNNLGNTYADQGSYDLSIENYLKALQMYEVLENKEGIARAIGNIGTVYYDEGNDEKALEYFFKALKINEENNNYDLLRYNHNNIGRVYKRQNKLEDATNSFHNALEVNEKTKNAKDASSRNYLQILARTSNFLGETYMLLNQTDSAFRNLNTALEFFEKTNDRSGKSTALRSLAILYEQLGKQEDALKFALKSLDVGKEIGAKDKIKDAAFTLATLYEKKGKSNEAYKMYQLGAAMKDSIYNSEKAKTINNLQLNYELDKKQREVELLQKESALQEQAIKSANFQRNAFVAGFALILVLAFVLVRNNLQKQKTNRLLSEQNAEIQAQKITVEEKNNEIALQNEELQQQQDELLAINEKLEESHQEIKSLYDKLNDSIRYASHIQGIILPSEDIFKQAFEDYFVIYKPRDVVSGDFYWFTENNNKKFLVLSDCTGHGVPGAFMSMVGNTLLHETINIKGVDDPARVLKNIHAGIRNLLKQETSRNNDGMDISVCVLENTDNKTIVTFAGAKTSIFYIHKGNIVELKGDSQAIGGAYKKDRYEYNNQTFELVKGDALYLSTDGYIDQNNEARERFGKQRFMEMLMKNFPNKMDVQKSFILDELADHQKLSEQRDDISLVGIRI